MNKWKWCLTDEQGNIIKGWKQEGTKWYHLNNTTGIMDTGWFKDTDGRWYYMNSDGEMQTGWLKDQGKWYYLEPNSTGFMGSAYVGTTATIDNVSYTFDSTGAMEDGDSNSLVSDKAINFIKSYEGFSATKYDDGTGVITQGYGCIGDEIAGWGDSVTEEFAASRLKDLVNNKYATVIKADLDERSITLTQNEFDALVSMSYNIGTDGLLHSSLYRYIVNGGRDNETIEADFEMWDKAGGAVMQGLLNRRIDEAEMFNSGDYTRDR